MLGALLFGLSASSALVIGGVAGAFWRPSRALVAVALAFASGALITALAFDLFEESFNKGGAWLSGVGLLVGAAAFVAADELLDRHIEGGGVSGFAILAAVTLDGVPENIALGVTLLEGAGSLVLLAFAGGAVLASLADTLMPDAYREGGALVAFATAAGFFLSFMIEHA